MQEAQVKRWARESHVSAAMLQSVRGLNHRFLDLIGESPRAWNSSGFARLPPELQLGIVPLTTAQKKAAANCPYALFDLHFHDDSYWRTRLYSDPPGNVADAAPLDDNMLDFARLALFFAWHVASTNKLASRLLLGMSDTTAAAFRVVPIDCLPGLAAMEVANVTARWINCPSYWSALTRAAARSNLGLLRRAQLQGLQLTAAASLG
jgi:hypothetical protein